MTLKSDAKFEEKLIYCFKNEKNLGNFRNTRNFFKHSKFVKFPL